MRLLILVFCEVFFTHCALKKEVALMRTLHKSYALPARCVVLLIPNAGCAGCISNGEQFALKNIHKYPNLYVSMISIRSKKLLNQKLGNMFLLHPTVKIDIDENIRYAAQMSINAKAVFIEQNKITKIAEDSRDYTGNMYAEMIEFLNKK
jgi:hypothetical protein